MVQVHARVRVNTDSQPKGEFASLSGVFNAPYNVFDFNSSEITDRPLRMFSLHKNRQSQVFSGIHTDKGEFSNNNGESFKFLNIDTLSQDSLAKTSLGIESKDTFSNQKGEFSKFTIRDSKKKSKQPIREEDKKDQIVLQK